MHELGETYLSNARSEIFKHIDIRDEEHDRKKDGRTKNGHGKQ